MSEPRANVKKLTARNVGIALGIISVILGMSLLWTIDIYNGTSASLNTQVKNLQSQVNDLYNLSILNKTEILLNNTTISLPAHNPASYAGWNYGGISYAGYIVVGLLPSSNITVQVTWDAYNLLVSPTQGQWFGYANQTTFGGLSGTWGYAIFPVLPTLSGWPYDLNVELVNNNAVGTAPVNVTITISYYY